MQSLLFEEGGSGESNILKTSLFCNFKNKGFVVQRVPQNMSRFHNTPIHPSFVFGKILCEGQKGVLYLPTLTSISLPADV